MDGLLILAGLALLGWAMLNGLCAIADAIEKPRVVQVNLRLVKEDNDGTPA